MRWSIEKWQTTLGGNYRKFNEHHLKGINIGLKLLLYFLNCSFRIIALDWQDEGQYFIIISFFLLNLADSCE